MPTRKNTKKLAPNPKTPLITSREWDFNTLRETFYFPCFIQKTESTLLRLRLTWLALPSQGAGAYLRNWELTPCHAPFPRWEGLESSACTVGPFASQQTSVGSADLTAAKLNKGGKKPEPQLLAGGPTLTHKCVWGAGRPGLPRDVPARWPWAVPRGLPLCEE